MEPLGVTWNQKDAGWRDFGHCPMVRIADNLDLKRTAGALALELQLTSTGTAVLAGVDEAGRGPLAGPVVAAAVIFKDCPALWQACDSKSINARRRMELYQGITEELDFAVGICEVEEIDSLNILRASLRAMEKAVASLSIKPSLVLVDGPFRLSTAIASQAIVRGDSRVAVIGAASIVAKVSRDQLMTAYDNQFPQYGFARNFGYPTAEHRAALKRLGPCSIHRKTFRGVREFFQEAV
jgi:ribonuclease HII